MLAVLAGLAKKHVIPKIALNEVALNQGLTVGPLKTTFSFALFKNLLNNL